MQRKLSTYATTAGPVLNSRLRDYCYRNGEPYPVREIPEEMIEMFESGDFSQIRKWKMEMPELKKVTK